MAILDILLIHVPIFQNFLFPITDMLPFVFRNLLGKLKAEYFDVELNPPSISVTDSGLLSIAAYLEREGITVGFFYPDIEESNPIIGFSEYLRALRNVIEKKRPSVIGAGPLTYQYPTSLALYRFIKLLNPEITTVIGGHHSTFMDVQTLRDSKSIDIVVRGEGEETLLRTVNAIIKRQSLGKIRGITYREQNNRIKKNDPAPPINPYEIPMPAYYLLPEWMQGKNKIWNFTAGRGCPYNCLFCTERNFWGSPRIRPITNILEELRYIHTEHNPVSVNFGDDSFTWDKQFVAELSSMMSKEDIVFKHAQFLMRVDETDDDRLNAIDKMGDKIELSLGIESSSPKVLKVMRKGITFDQSVTALKKIKEHGAIPRAFWIIGHPGSDPEAEEISYKGQEYLMKKELCMLNEISVFVPYPGLEPFSQPSKYGVEILSYDWSRYCENPSTFPPVSCLKNLKPMDIFHYYVKRHTLSIKALTDYFGYDWKDISLKTSGE